MTVKFSGGCLCGAVRYEGEAEPLFAGHCHCVDCRKAHSAGHASLMAVPKEALQITGELKYYDRGADSGSVVSRAFCPTCGSNILNRPQRWPDLVVLSAATFDDPDVFEPQFVIFESRRPKWDEVAGDFPRFPEDPPQG